MADMISKERDIKAKGSENGGAKLNEADIPLIRTMLECGERTGREISTVFGVSATAIWKIKNKIKWGHIPWVALK